MDPYVIPALLTILIALPAAVISVVALAQSTLGRALGAPARGPLSYWGYLKVLLGAQPKSNTDWSSFETLLTKVAHGEVHVWDTLGPESPTLNANTASHDTRKPTRSHWGGPLDRGDYGDYDNDGPLGAAQRGEHTVSLAAMVIKPLIIVVTVLFTLWLISAVLLDNPSPSSTRNAAAIGKLEQFAFSLETGTPWVTAGDASVQTVVATERMPALIAAVGRTGGELTCPGITPQDPATTSTPGAAKQTTPAQARGGISISCFGGLEGVADIAAIRQGAGYLVVLTANGY